MNEVQLEVAKAYPNDSGRGIARLDPDTLLHLKLSPGDIIEIEGAETTAAKVWRADRQDWNTDTVRVDGFTRQNADVGIGERVTIRKAEGGHRRHTGVGSARGGVRPVRIGRRRHGETTDPKTAGR